MHIIKFGSDSEFLKLEIPPNLSPEDWIDISVEIKTNHFSGSISPCIELRDILSFTVALEKLYETLKGSASFEPRERQFKFKLESQVGGKIELSGVAWSEASYGSKLEFYLSLDQTFLYQPLSTLKLLAFKLKSNA